MALKSVPCCSGVNMPRTKWTFTSASGAQYQLLAGGELRFAMQVCSCASMVAAGMKSIKAIGKAQSLVGGGETGKNERVSDRSAPRFKLGEPLLALRFNDAFNFDHAKCVAINPNAAHKKARFHVLRVRRGGRSNVDDECRSRVDQLGSYTIEAILAD